MVEADGKRLAFDIALWRLQEQVERSRTLDSRLGGAFALSAAMVAVLGSAFLFAEPQLAGGARAALYAASVFFLLNVLASAAAFISDRLGLAPPVTELIALSEALDGEQLTLWALTPLEQALVENDHFLERKRWLVSLAIAATVATAICVVADGILQVSL